MATSNVNYNCTSPPPSNYFPSNSDVDGYGVLIGFMGTAYFTVTLLVISYFCAYDPEEDAIKDARTPNESEYHPSKTNSLDMFVLQRCLRHRFQKNFLYKFGIAGISTTRLRKSLEDCVSCMADTQILTGLAILISGFSSLNNGLSAAHWQMIVYLSWFSAFTHLATLTFLRGYLIRQQGLRIWRLLSMFVIVLLLATALVPTGNFTLDKAPQLYAKCYFHVPDHKHLTEDQVGDFANMILSMVVVSYAFISRVLKLHGRTSSVLRKTRSYISNQFIRLLDFLEEKTESNSSTTPSRPLYEFGRSLARTLVFQQLCAMYLVVRSFLQITSSMFFEILWLCYAMVWGTMRLLYTRAEVSNYRKIHHLGTENSWSFGQIIPVILLAAPVISVLEIIFPGRQNHAVQSSSLATLIEEEAIGKATIPQTQITQRNDPQSNPQITKRSQQYREDNIWSTCISIYMILLTLETAIMVFLTLAIDSLPIAETMIAFFAWYAILWPLSIYCFALLAISLQNSFPILDPLTYRWYFPVFCTCCFLMLVISIFPAGTYSFFVSPSMYTACGFYVVYLLGCFVMASLQLLVPSWVSKQQYHIAAASP